MGIWMERPQCWERPWGSFKLQLGIPGNSEVMWGKTGSVWIKKVERSCLSEQLEETRSASWNKESENGDYVESLLRSENSRGNGGKVCWRERKQLESVPQELTCGVGGMAAGRQRAHGGFAAPASTLARAGSAGVSAARGLSLEPSRHNKMTPRQLSLGFFFSGFYQIFFFWSPY